MVKASGKIRRARPLLGTFVEVEAAGGAKSELSAAIDAAFAAIARVHALMSFHDLESDVSRLNREAQHRPTTVDAWTFRVLEAAVELHRQSKGVFDVAIAPALQAMGLLPHSSGVSAAARGSQIFDAIELLSDQAVRFRSAGTRIDLGGIAKGFAVDRACEAMRSLDISGGMVNAGGDLAVFGRDPQTVHIRDPRHPGRLICSVALENEALASTARRFDPFQSPVTANSAVIDPARHKVADAIDGVSVRASSCMIADALTKVVMIEGSEAAGLLEYYNAGALMISGERELQITPNLHHVVRLAA
jgi:FAD:protein FMN transferase